jgi:hypothetical protein
MESRNAFIDKLRERFTGESKGEQLEREAQESYDLIELARSRARDASSKHLVDEPRPDSHETFGHSTPRTVHKGASTRDGAPWLMRILGFGNETSGEIVARKDYEEALESYLGGATDARIARAQSDLERAEGLQEATECRRELANARLDKALVLGVFERIKNRNLWFLLVGTLGLPAACLAGLASDPGLALLLVPAAALWARVTSVSPAKIGLPLALTLGAYGASRFSGGSGLYLAHWFAQTFSWCLLGFGALNILSRGFGDSVSMSISKVRGQLAVPRRYRVRWNALALLIALGGYVFPFAYQYAAPWHRIAQAVGIPGASELPLPAARRSVTVEARRMLASESDSTHKARLDLETELALRPSLVKFSSLDGGGWSAIYPKAFFTLLGAAAPNYNGGPLWIDGPESGHPGRSVAQPAKPNDSVETVSKPIR